MKRLPPILAACLLLTGCHNKPNHAALQAQIAQAGKEEQAAMSAMGDNIVAADQKAEALALMYAAKGRVEKWAREVEAAPTDDAKARLDLDEIAASRANAEKMRAVVERWKQRQP